MVRLSNFAPELPELGRDRAAADPRLGAGADVLVEFEVDQAARRHEALQVFQEELPLLEAPLPLESRVVEHRRERRHQVEGPAGDRWQPLERLDAVDDLLQAQELRDLPQVGVVDVEPDRLVPQLLRGVHEVAAADVEDPQPFRLVSWSL